MAGEVARVLAAVALPAETAARVAGQYSGGSRRKLALGIALVGGVDAVLLDEPSSGMVSPELAPWLSSWTRPQKQQGASRFCTPTAWCVLMSESPNLRTPPLKEQIYLCCGSVQCT